MSEFINVKIDMGKCTGIGACGQCVQVCPVNIFRAEEDVPHVVADNEDECILCELCIKECVPEAITLYKLYE